jgi:hypothetical protein
MVDERVTEEKMTVFWDVAPCSLVELTGVSEVLAAPSSGRCIALMTEKSRSLSNCMTPPPNYKSLKISQKWIKDNLKHLPQF